MHFTPLNIDCIWVMDETQPIGVKVDTCSQREGLFQPTPMRSKRLSGEITVDAQNRYNRFFQMATSHKPFDIRGGLAAVTRARVAVLKPSTYRRPRQDCSVLDKICRRTTNL
jgi:hypothetical protein